MRDVRHGLELGAAAQLVLLAVLDAGPGLGVAGVAAGLAFGGTVVLLLLRALRTTDLGLANAITLGRAVLVGGVVALVAAGATHTTVIAALATPALLFDLVDGRVARRQCDVTALGARFDMEVDASLILVLSVAVTGSAGGWVLAIGAARYAFVAAGFVLPWLRETAPARPWCKVVAATQGVVLVTCVSGLLPGPASTGALATALVLLAESFGRETWWLWRNRTASVPAEVSRDLLAAQL